MAGIERHPAGAFCWVELGTTDVAAAKAFYGGLFGWTAEDMPMGEGQAYTMLKLAGLETGAMYKLTAEMLQQKIPPNWMLYVTVESVDATMEKVKENGGQVAVGPFDVGEAGRMAVIRDPQGAVVSMWQAKGHIGIRVAGAAGSLCWSELATTDRVGARQFYTQVFGWGTKIGQMGPVEYTQWLVGEMPVGGMLEMTEEWEGAPPHWMPYFLVADCDASADQSKALGGTVCVPPTDVPNEGRFAVLQDPQGAYFSIIRLSAG
ncbi:MAG: VOC family protein [Acidobacteria bacterium]|nr:VOC family protein [Acidobacteriota bacterium]